MAWQTIELREVADLVTRRVQPQPGSPYRQVGVHLHGQGAYERGTIDGSETQYSALYKIREGDIIVNKIWARRGSIAVVPASLDGCYGSPEFPTYTVDQERMLPAWFRWFSCSPNLWLQCDMLSRGTSGQNRLKPKRFLEVRVPLPPLDKQRHIVARLDRVASLVDERRRVLVEAEMDADALLYKVFKKVVAGANYLPMERVAPLIRRLIDVQPDEIYSELGVRSFGRGTFHKPVLEGTKVGNKKLFRIKPGDLVFNIVFAWEGAIAIAQADDAGRVGSHRFLTCIPDPTLASADFLLYYFLTREGLNKLDKASPGGAGRNRTLGLKKLGAIEVPVPSIERQQWFDGAQFKIRDLKRTRDETTIELAALIPAMLYEVFGGSI